MVAMGKETSLSGQAAMAGGIKTTATAMAIQTPSIRFRSARRRSKRKSRGIRSFVRRRWHPHIRRVPETRSKLSRPIYGSILTIHKSSEM